MKHDTAFSIAVLVLLGLILGGCGNNGTYKPKPVRIFLWSDIKVQRQLEKEFTKFEKKHPDTAVKLEFAPWDRHQQKLEMMVAGGVGPDVTIVSSVWFAACAHKSILTDLNPFVNADPSFDLNDFYQEALDGWARYKGRLYGIPKGVDIYAMFYNSDLFDSAGLSYPDWNLTWEEFADVAKKLTADTNGDGRVDRWGAAPTWWQIYVWQNGGEIFDKAMTKCLLDDPAAYEAIQWAADLRNRYHAMPTVAEAADVGSRQLFEQGRLAMYIAGSWVIPEFLRTIDGFHWDVAPLPKGKAGRVSFYGGSCFSILNDSRQPEKAWEVIKFLTGKERQAYEARVNQVIPSRKSVAESRDFLLADTLPENRKIFLEMIPYGRATPAHPSFNEIDALVRRKLEEVFLGMGTAQEVCSEIAINVNRILASSEP